MGIQDITKYFAIYCKAKYFVPISLNVHYFFFDYFSESKNKIMGIQDITKYFAIYCKAKYFVLISLNVHYFFFDYFSESKNKIMGIQDIWWSYSICMIKTSKLEVYFSKKNLIVWSELNY